MASDRRELIDLYHPASSEKLAPEEAWDADGDGLPDLLYFAPFVASVTSESGGDYPASGPLLLAHAKADGTFDTNDAVAKSVAGCACKAPPGAATASAGGTLLEQIACARIRGADGQALVATQCARRDAPRDCSSKAVRALATLQSPVTLP